MGFKEEFEKIKNGNRSQVDLDEPTLESVEEIDLEDSQTHPEYSNSRIDQLIYSLKDIWIDFKRTTTKILIILSIAANLAMVPILIDWWGFIVSEEYAQYKAHMNRIIYQSEKK